MSIVMALYLYFMQIPYTSLLIQGYKCQKYTNETKSDDISCDSSTSQILKVASTLLIIIYYAFILT
jgi:hypothetical protein